MLNRRDVRGFTLIEALVALGITLAGVAGATVLLLRGVQYERESAIRRHALRLAGSLAEELRAANPGDGTPLPADAPAIAAWRALARATLPEGSDARAEPLAVDPAAYRITIDWPVAGLGMQRFTLAVTP
ncbi:MAG TPA: prepilin-type N-terminal cleavage/methylation domain-containing protein [Steroidobacteraceae bacterium]|nr:prepilin-type N-terminal cleavage/methylation domain-containing protein [Steroidobacteraceae bacterium]